MREGDRGQGGKKGRRQGEEGRRQGGEGREKEGSR